MLTRSLAIAAVVLTTAPSMGVAAATSGAGRLTLVATHPIVVRGAHFQAGERVRVTVTTQDGSGVRAATAGSSGTFVMRFPSLSLPACAMYAIRAVGAMGTHALVRVVPECANGPAP